MNKKKIISIIISIILLIIIAFTSMLSKDLKQERQLKREINSLSTLFEADTLDYKAIEEKLSNTVTTGDYLTVETASKKYLADVVNMFKEIEEVTSDEKITALLETKNLKKDGPSFKESKKYLKDYLTKLDKISEEVNNCFNEEKILSYLESDNLDDYYVKLYKKLTLGTNYKKIEKDKEEMLNGIDTLKTMIQKEEKIIDFLIKNKGNWIIQDDSVAFYSQKHIDEYNKLIKELTTYASKVGA